MAVKKIKTFKKLKRTRFWPSVLMFLAFAAVSAGLVVGGLQLLSGYIVGLQLSNACSQAKDTGIMLERSLKEGSGLSEAVSHISGFREGQSGLYIVDQSGAVVAHTGKSTPDLEESYSVTLGEVYELYKDEHSGSPQDILDMKLPDLLRQTFQEPPQKGHKERGEWMHENAMEQQFWVKVPIDQKEYDLYVECMVHLQRQDVYYVVQLGVITLLIVLVPLIFMFIHTVINIYAQRKMTKLLYMDAVTGGHNWMYFEGMTQRILGRMRNSRKAYALVDLHLVHYANYVAFYGSEEGEELLRGMDAFLRARMQHREVFGHNGSADFGLILRCEGNNEEEWRNYCRDRLRSLLAELAGLQPERKLHFHAGVYMIPPVNSSQAHPAVQRKELDISQLYSYASTAQRKENCGEEQIFFYDHALLEAQNWEQWVENHMNEALTAEEFQVYLQPKYEPATGRLVGAEALVRWFCPDQGMIPPGKFIPIFESNGFIAKLDDYMLAQIAKLQAEWAVQGKKAVPVSVNVSRIHFSRDDLAEHIARLVDAYGARHELIELEVTESAFFDDKDSLIHTVSQLRAYGFHISMDDFGAGYSSLNSLKDIPLDVLKLDAEFFRGEDTMGRGRIIVREAVSLAKQLDMRVVAEGVEYKEQVDFLASIGCDMIQGYYFAKPMPVSEFEQRVEKDA